MQQDGWGITMVEVGEGRAHSLMYTAGWVGRHGGGARGRGPQHAVHSKHHCAWHMLLMLDSIIK